MGEFSLDGFFSGHENLGPASTFYIGLEYPPFGVAKECSPPSTEVVVPFHLTATIFPEGGFYLYLYEVKVQDLKISAQDTSVSIFRFLE